MVPFCRTLDEADRVIEEMKRNGLERRRNELKIYMMCEIPSNVILARQFAQRFDGFSIGSNDLTQLTLGADRDSELLAGLFDERDPAVLKLVSQAIAEAHHSGVKIGLCGQGPSDHPDYAAFLVNQGIDSISLNPDSFIRTVEIVAQAESAAVTSEWSGRRPAITIADTSGQKTPMAQPSASVAQR
jgi:pyruvate,water dikinase